MGIEPRPKGPQPGSAATRQGQAPPLTSAVSVGLRYSQNPRFVGQSVSSPVRGVRDVSLFVSVWSSGRQFKFKTVGQSFNSSVSLFISCNLTTGGLSGLAMSEMFYSTKQYRPIDHNLDLETSVGEQIAVKSMQNQPLKFRQKHSPRARGRMRRRAGVALRPRAERVGG